MTGPSRAAIKASCWAIERGTFCHFRYQVGALFNPYLGIRSGGRGVQTFHWMRSIQKLVLQLDTWMHSADRIYSRFRTTLFEESGSRIWAYLWSSSILAGSGQDCYFFKNHKIEPEFGSIWPCLVLLWQEICRDYHAILMQNSVC